LGVGKPVLVGADVDSEVLLEVAVVMVDGILVLVCAVVDTEVLLEVAVVSVDGTLVLDAIQLQALLTLPATFPVHAATAKDGTV